VIQHTSWPCGALAHTQGERRNSGDQKRAKKGEKKSGANAGFLGNKKSYEAIT
jgi:hypothetical protein